MTYYGRWTYKYEIASEKGAAACIIVHETGPAGYPYEVIIGQSGAAKISTSSNANKNMDRVPVEAWITVDKAKELFSASGKDFYTLKNKPSVKILNLLPWAPQANFSYQ